MIRRELDRSQINYMPLKEATSEPSEGYWEVLIDRWWSYEPDKGLLFYRRNPQCNRHKSIAKMVSDRCHPDAELIFVPRVYVRHNCSDYF